jgi:hypothetical protein
MRFSHVVAFGSCALVLAVACGGSSDSTFGSSGGFGTGSNGGSTGIADGGGGASACGDGTPCAEGMVCDENTKTCIPGGTCGAEEATGTSTPPNVLVVLDRSCSMTDKGTPTKWEIAVDALKTLTKQNNGKIRFGLELFPDKAGNECNQGPIEIPVAPNNEQKMETLLTKALSPGDPFFPEGPCVTNIDAAMQAASQEPAFADKTRGNFAILLTDGKQAGCATAGGDQGTKKILEDMFTKNQVPTFVIGFGSGIDPAQMNEFAVAGGTPNSDPTTKYYKAEDKASLTAALSAIAKKTLSCVFELSKAPPDATKIFAFFDNKTAVPRDPAKSNGWEYDPATNTVTFYGAACDELRLAKVTDVDIVFGCPEATPR